MTREKNLIADFRAQEADLDKAVEIGRDYARTCAQGSTGVTPNLMIEYATGLGTEGCTFEWQAVCLLDVPFNEDDEKERILRSIAKGLYLAKRIPRTAILISEAWQSQSRGEPRKDPHRQEVVAVFVATMDGRGRLGHFDLRRDAGGKIHLLDWHAATTNARSPLLAKLFRAFAEESGFFKRLLERN